MTDTVHVSAHAISRYRLRVDPGADYQTARKALTSPAILTAIRFGASIVKLPGKQRVIVKNRSIVTVLPAGAAVNWGKE